MNVPLWRFEEAVAAAGGDAVAGEGAVIASVSIDSRTLEPGALFVAIRGERLDGHAYVAAAFEAGAAAAVVAQDWTGDGIRGPLIRVDDTLAGLNGLGQAARARTGASIVAVTGSVGKTGSKEALRLALGASGSVHASEKSFNNQWGVPLSLAMMSRCIRFGIFEVGMNHPGEILPLTRLVRPHIAIVTTVEPVHLEFFHSVTEIAEAKAEIFQGLEPGGTAILNRDNAHFDLLRRRAIESGADRIIGFGRHADAEARLVEERLESGGSEVRAVIDGREVRYHLGVPGAHLVTNSLAVLAAARAVGAELQAAASALGGLVAQKGRGERVLIGRTMIIDESYNANPASMRAALKALGQTPRAEFPRRIAVLGDMLELGTEGPALHRGLADVVDAAGADVVFACGRQMALLYDALPANRRGTWGATSAEIEEALLAEIRGGDVVMIKGSLGSRMGPLVEALKVRRDASVGGAPGHDSAR